MVGVIGSLLLWLLLLRMLPYMELRFMAMELALRWWRIGILYGKQRVSIKSRCRQRRALLMIGKIDVYSRCGHGCIARLIFDLELRIGVVLE